MGGSLDLAFVESVVGAGLATVFFLLTLFQIAPKDTVIQRTPPPLAALLALPPLGLLLFYAAEDLPAFGDPASPAKPSYFAVYLENSLQGHADAQCRDLNHHGLPRLRHAD